jgi:iron(III) transport system substrate-binding protein
VALVHRLPPRVDSIGKCNSLADIRNESAWFASAESTRLAPSRVRPGSRIGSMITHAVVLTTAALCLAALPAQAAPRTVAEIAYYDGADRQQLLEDGARHEGALMLYATGTQIQPLLDRFMQKYPFIKVAMPRASSIDVTRKVIEEYGAGLYQVDAYELSSYGLVVERDLGLLQPFISPELADYAATAIEPARNWVSVRESYLGIGYNTQKISAQDAPKSYQDLLAPQWKSKMAISGSLSTSANWVGAMVISLGADYVKKLGQQDIRIYELTGRALANLTIAGEVPLSPTIYNSHVEASRAQGAPIAWNVPGPVPVTDTSTALAFKAPHPNAAMLLIDFLMSKEGQTMYRDLGYVPSRNGMAAPDFPVLQKIYLTNRPNYVQEFEQWTALVRETIFKGGRRN